VDDICKEIKETRRTITHGYAHYYDFKTDPDAKHYILLLDKLIKKMSLKYIGFTDDDISKYPI